MSPKPGTGGFFESLAPFDDFAQVANPRHYRPVPAGWMVGLSDVVSSTEAIAQGRYKAVNMAGACAISAVMNTLAHAPFPFVFGGDGAGFAVPGEKTKNIRAALAASAAWVRDELGLELRVAMVPIEAIRKAGHDVRVARYAASDHLAYAMFSGGGLAWAEAQMKTGAFAVSPAPAGTMPDLTGLTCRWAPISPQRDMIMSLVAMPQPRASARRFNALIRDILKIAGDDPRGGHPIARAGPRFAVRDQAIRLESLTPANGKQQPFWRVGLIHMALWLLFKTGVNLGRFDPAHYRRVVAANSDFRKFDDGLRMTLDCSDNTRGRLEAALRAAYEDGIVHFGLHAQDAALMTCIVPSALRDDHLHFLDGAGGGYAMAARALKAQMAGGKGNVG